MQRWCYSHFACTIFYIFFHIDCGKLSINQHYFHWKAVLQWAYYFKDDRDKNWLFQRHFTGKILNYRSYWMACIAVIFYRNKSTEKWRLNQLMGNSNRSTRHIYEFSIDWKTPSKILYNCKFLDCTHKEELPDVSSLRVFSPNSFSNKRLFKENLRLYPEFNSICISVNCILLIRECRMHLLQICSQWDCTIIYKFVYIQTVHITTL